MATLDREAFAREMVAIEKTVTELEKIYGTEPFKGSQLDYYKRVFDNLESLGYYIGRRGYTEGGMRID